MTTARLAMDGAGPGTDTGLDGAPRLAFDPGRLDIPALAEAYDTPLYLYDLDVVTRRVAGLRAALPPGVSLAYAVKANPSLAVLAHLASLGLGADVASAAELRTALRAGFEAGRLVMTGPGKRREEHLAAVDAGAVVTVESPGELERLERASAAAGRVTPILLRASASEESAEDVRIIGDSGAGKFGMDDADLRVAARLAAASPHLELLGLHRFGASNVTDWRRLVQAAEIAVQLAAEILGSVDRPVRIVDVGGGLGIPYADGEPALDVVALGRGLASLLESAAGSRATRDLRLVLEPGRFLVGPAGVYVARVVDRKSVRGSRVAILDG
ncbi:MAG TPA: alanine racemase, partial [Candidatus Limnocylindrales bacterium]